MQRSEIKKLQDIPNIGKAMEKDLLLLGIRHPVELIGRDPYQMYSELCEITGIRHDPCVIDVFISAVKYMQGGPSVKWWTFTNERKQKMGVK